MLGIDAGVRAYFHVLTAFDKPRGMCPAIVERTFRAVGCTSMLLIPLTLIQECPEIQLEVCLVLNI